MLSAHEGCIIQLILRELVLCYLRKDNIVFVAGAAIMCGVLCDSHSSLVGLAHGWQAALGMYHTV